MAQLNLSGLIRTSDLPVGRGCQGWLATRVASTTWSWRAVAAVAALGRLGPLGGLGGGVLRASAHRCAGGCARCPKRCATKRRFSTDLAAALAGLARVSPPRPPIWAHHGHHGSRWD